MNPQEIRQIGRYPVRRFIAEGGMAWVFEVVDPNFDAPRALKMLKPGVAAGDLFRRFQDEARILARLEHPNLVTIFDFGLDEASGCHFYTMTLIDTPPLSKRGVLPLEEAAPIFLDVLAGLARLHEGGIVHRDIKPGNILIHPDGRAMLADLGIARTADLSEGETWFTAQGHGTSTGIAIGTPAYMSPEQARGRRGITTSTDVFSFGLTMYNALTGRTVYEEIDQIDSTSGQDILAYLGHLSFSHEEFEFHFGDDVPDPVREVVYTACRIDPEERYPDASAMREALEEALEESGHEPVRRASSSRRATSGERRARPVESRPRARTGQRQVAPPLEEEDEGGRPWALIAGAAVLAIGVAGGGWWAWTRIHNNRLAESLEETAQLEQQVARLVDAEASATPAVAREVLSAAREKQRSASMLLQHARTKREKGEGDSPVFLQNAREGFVESCGVLVDGDLADRFAKATEAARRGAEGLGKLDVKDLAPDAWAKLEQQIGALTPPEATPAKCQLAEAYQAKLGEVRLASAGTRALEQQLQKQWPQLAAAAREEALRAQASAAAARLPVPEFQAAVERAQQALAAGDADVAAESYLAARDAFWKAKDGFAAALAVAGAAQAQQALHALESQAAQAHLVDDEIRKEVARADGLYAAGSFDEAKQVYERTAKFLGVAIEKGQRSQGAQGAKRAADEARAQALADGAEKSASAELAKADAALGDASAAFEGERFDDAEHGYAAARATFQSASRLARAALDRARKAGAEAREAAKQTGDCAALDAKQARPECLAAAQALAQGDAAVEQGDAGAALARYGTASEGFGRASEDNQAAIENRNRPPKIASRIPASQTYSARKGEVLSFEIEAKDPNPGDVLHYAWSVDGKNRPESGPVLKLTPRAKSRVEVRVDDGRGGEDAASWDVSVTNTSPKLALTPASDVRLEVGEAKSFAAQASDPDGDDVSVALLLDGKPVGQGGTYTFQSETPGTHRLEARATDTDGAVTAKTLTITVAPPNSPPKLALTPAQDSISLDRGKKQSFVAKTSDPDGDDVSVAFLLDGKPVGQGGSYTFQGQTPGTYVLEAKATDARGAVATQSRTITVANVNHPPNLSLEPAKEAINLEVGKKQEFSAQARDPDGDDVTVSLQLDGKSVGEGGSYTFQGQSPGTHVLEAKATDAQGAVTTQRRTITVANVANRPPKLTLDPAQEAINLEVGKKQEFSAQARDADGEEVAVAFLLDGKPVGEGGSYTFQGQSPGTHVLEAKATDARGAVAVLQRRIVVAAVPPPPPPPPTAGLAPRPPPPPVGGRDPHEIAETALQEYKAAYESRDIDRLAKIWSMTESQKANTANFFRAKSKVSMAVSQRGVRETGEKVTVDFDQTISADGIPPSPVQLRATLEKVGTQWKITGLGKP